ncbi:MAG: carboxypeptidase regulatory-like domain-containing protein [Bacteroidota bacterium]
MKTLVALAIAATLLASAAAAQESRRYTLTVRGTDVSTALAEVVRLTGIDLVYPSELASDQPIFCAEHDATAEALLRCVLDGTGLDFVRTSSGAYLLIEAPEQTPPPGHLAGRVVDAETGAPLPFAHVLLADAALATAADADGVFAFADLLPGRYEVIATHVAYAPSGPQAVFIEPGTAARMEVVLDGALSEAAPVVVDGLVQRVPSALLGLGERAVTATPTAPSATGTPDVMAGGRSFLGVAAVPAIADLHIQGGGAAEHLVRLDGVAVRDPVALGRHLGAFSPLALDRMTVHKAGFGPALGSQLTGVLDLAHRLGDAAPSATLAVDPVSADLRLGAPVSLPGLGRGHAMAAVRQSLWGLGRAGEDAGLRTLLRDWGTADPVFTSLWLDEAVHREALAPASFRPTITFTDAHAAARLRPDAFTTLHVSAYGARNHVDADRSVLRTEATGTSDLLGFRDGYDWRNGAAQLRATRLVGARTVIGAQARAAHHRSGYAYRFARSELTTQSLPATESALFAAIDGARGGQANHRLTELALDLDGSLSLAPGREVRAVLGVEHTRAIFEADHDFITPLDLDAAAWWFTGVLDARTTLGLRTTLEAGTRLTFVPDRQTLYAEPRASVRYDGAAPFGTYALRLAGGLYRQFVNGYAFRNPGPTAIAPDLLFWLPTTDTAPPRALHLAADALVMPGETWTLRAEGFARWESRLLALDIPTLQANLGPQALPISDPNAALAGAAGRTLGGGLRFEHQRDGLRWGASYAFEDARRTVPGRFDGRRVAVPWSAPHRLRLDGDLGLGRLVTDAGVRGLVQAAFGRRWGYRTAYYDYLLGGATTIDDALGEGLLDANFLDALAEPDEAALPAEVRLDLGLYVDRRIGPAQLRVDVGVIDALDRANVFDWSRTTPASGGAELARGLPGRRWTAQLRVTL